MNINYDSITLRAIEKDDMELLREMMNDNTIEENTAGFSFPVSTHQQLKWYENLQSDNNTFRAIIDTAEHGAVGTVILSDIDWKNGTAEFHYKISSSGNCRGLGYGTKAARATLYYAFQHLNLQCIYATVLESNEISAHIFNKIGFSHEGTLRNRIYKNGQYNALQVWSILKDEFVN